MQDAFTTALERWPRDGIPPSPAGWIITTARNRAIDRLRRETSRDERHEAAMRAARSTIRIEEHDVKDDHLRLIFTCCHPALAPEAQLALTLRLVGGLTTARNRARFPRARSRRMAQRISRAKAKIRDAGIPYRVPDAAELPARLRCVLAVVYLIFNEGYSATTGETLVRAELCDEAIRLGRLLLELVASGTRSRGLAGADVVHRRAARRSRRRGRRVRASRGSGPHRAGTARGSRKARYLMRACLRA